MKKTTIILLSIMLLFFCATAQEDEPKVAVGVRVGINGSSLLIPRSTFESAYSTNYNSEQAMKVGAVAGLDIDIKLKEKLSLQTGLFYSWQRFGQEQGAVFTDTNNVRYSIGSVNQYTVHHLRLPVMVKYHFSTNPNHFVIAAGLYADYALSGEITYDASAVLTQENQRRTRGEPVENQTQNQRRTRGEPEENQTQNQRRTRGEPDPEPEENQRRTRPRTGGGT